MFKPYLIIALRQIHLVSVLLVIYILVNGSKIDDNSSKIAFDKQKIKDNSQKINYLYGQLFDIHAHNLVLYASNSMKNYKGANWTTNRAIAMELFHLGVINNSISQFSEETYTALFSKTVRPTLSPRDPNFIDWYDSYLAEMKKSEGPTPDEK